MTHLTGIYLINKEGVLVKNHIQFYRKCLQNRLSESEIRSKAALPQIINFINCSKMVAIYHEIRPKLAVDLLTGTTNFCLGFTGDKRGAGTHLTNRLPTWNTAVDTAQARTI